MPAVKRRFKTATGTSVRWYVRITPRPGKQLWRSLDAVRKPPALEVAKIEAEMWKEARIDRASPRKAGTEAAEVVRLFIETQKGQAKSRVYVEAVEQVLNACQKDLRTPDLDGWTLLRLEEHLRQGQAAAGWAEGKRPWRQRHFNFRRQVICRFLAWAKKRGFAAANPAVEIERQKEEKKKPRYLRREEITALLAACRTYDAAFRRNPNPIEEVVRMILGTGARISEVVSLTWENVDFETNRIRLLGTKTKTERVIPISATAGEVLRARSAKTGRVFPGLTTSGIAIRRVYKMAGIPRTGWHVLRHTFAAHLATAGVPIRLISAYLGHSFSRTTELYAHLVPSEDDRSIEAIDLAVAVTCSSGPKVEAPAGSAVEAAKPPNRATLDGLLTCNAASGTR